MDSIDDVHQTGKPGSDSNVCSAINVTYLDGCADVWLRLCFGKGCNEKNKPRTTRLYVIFNLMIKFSYPSGNLQKFNHIFVFQDLS